MQGKQSRLIAAQVPRSLAEAMSAAARRHDRSLSGEIREALRLHLAVITAAPEPEPAEPEAEPEGAS